MSMSTHVVGIVPPDLTYKRMMTVWEGCKAANVAIPKEVHDFFDGAEPDGKGLTIDIPHSEYLADMESGIEVHLEDIPPQVKTIRFFNSY